MRKLTKPEISDVVKLRNYLIAESEHPYTQQWVSILGEIEKCNTMGRFVGISKQEMLVTFDELIKVLDTKQQIYGSLKRANKFDTPEERQEKKQWNAEVKQVQTMGLIARRLFNICSVTG